jgi:branched-chain amino acid transport system substrate-binding protein
VHFFTPEYKLSLCYFCGIALFILALLLLAAQCNAPPGPPLPTTPTGPALRVALLSPTAGEMATFGRMMRNGSIMAFDEWNEQGGVWGHRLAWSIYDTNCDFDTARQTVQQAIDEEHQFIIGPLCSEAAIAAATVAEAEQVLMISPTATHPLVTVNGQEQTRTTIFRASYVWTWQAKAAARFAADTLKINQAALLVPANDEYATSLADAFTLQFTAQGGEIVYQGTYSANGTDLAATLAAISQAGAEVIYLPTEAAITNHIANQLHTMGLSSGSVEAEKGITLLGSDSWQSPELDLAATTGSYFTTHFVLNDDQPMGQGWAEAYKSTYAIEPNTLAALGYDAANILISAIEQAGRFEPAAITTALEQGQFEGVTGRMSFDARHNPIKSVPIVHINQNGVGFSTSVRP